MEPVVLPDAPALRIDGVTYEIPKSNPIEKRIKITASKGAMDFMGILPELAKQLPEGLVLSSLVYGSVAIPYEGVALTAEMYEVVK